MDDTFIRALLAANGIALIAGPLGCFIVWKRLAFFGDTLAHSALFGAALGLLLGFDLPLAVLAVSLTVALAVYTLKRSSFVAPDALLGFLSHTFVAAGLVLLATLAWKGGAQEEGHEGHGHEGHNHEKEGHEEESHEGHDHEEDEHEEHGHEEESHEGHNHAEEGHGEESHEEAGHAEHAGDNAHFGHNHGSESGYDLEALLFGDIFSVSTADLWMIYLGGALALGLLAALWRPMFASCASEEIAQVESKSQWAHLVFMVLMAVMVALALKLVGAFLVTALLIIPAVTARTFVRGPEQMAIAAIVCGLIAVNGGLVGSTALETPPGATVIVTASALFLLGLGARFLMKNRM